mmetsp:Transcript_85842/g.216143  ORF Transcript_85842/g.216143 Transcript_85842/m.216143 type:complete len:194 (-) Transcript_85842:20-601(-)
MGGARTWESVIAYAADRSLPCPDRDDFEEARYDAQKVWLASRGEAPHEYVLRIVDWDAHGLGLEPCLVPYCLEGGVEHWILWFHPERYPPAEELPPEDMIKEALRRFLGVQPAAEWALWYENLPSKRSVPAVRHLHVFLRLPMAPPDVVANAARLRSDWAGRSEWLQEERVRTGPALTGAAPRESGAVAVAGS